MKSTAEIKEFYDADTRRKFKIRNNLRHFVVINKLIELGLQKNSRVLEIGCGNGGVTRLIAKKAANGRITAIDISEECVNAARSNLADFKNIEYAVSDMSDFSPSQKFDIIVLADVLEHIPIAHHDELFRSMSRMLDADGFIFIHIPEPKCLEWLTRTRPEGLQIIDQPLHSDELLAVAYKNGLYLTELKSYPIFQYPSDYQYLVLTKREKVYSYQAAPAWKIIAKKWYYRFKNGF